MTKIDQKYQNSIDSMKPVSENSKLNMPMLSLMTVLESEFYEIFQNEIKKLNSDWDGG